MVEENSQIQETIEVASEPIVQQVQPTAQENNLIAMRKRLEAEESARIAAERRASELEQRIQNSNQIPVSSSFVETAEEEEIGIDNDDYIQAKHIKTSNKKFNTKLSATERKTAELEQKVAYLEAKLDTDALKDFDQVVSDDNVRTLARLYPPDYRTAMLNPNLKEKSRTIYNMIKNYGIAVPREVRDADNKIAANKQKPQLASAGSPQVGQTPLSRLNDYERRVMTEERRDQILAEVERKKMGR